MRRKVLVVDDDPYLTTQLRKLLESDELSVDTVSSAQEALTALAATDYSVLITDLRMPGMGGMDLIREVAQRRRAGHDDRHDRRSARSTGWSRRCGWARTTS